MVLLYLPNRAIDTLLRYADGVGEGGVLYFSGKSKELAVTGEPGPGPVVPILSQMNHQFVHSLVKYYPSSPVCIGSSQGEWMGI